MITDTVFEVCSEFLKPTKRKHSYWFDFEDTNIDQLLKQRTCQRQAFLKSRTKDSEFQYKQSKLRVRKYLRNMENAFWKKQCEQLQVYANRGDTHKLYKQIKRSHGPQQSRRLSQSFLKKDGSTTSSTDEALERLQEYYSELLNRGIIKHMKNHKAISVDPTPIEIYKYGTQQFSSCKCLIYFLKASAAQLCLH